MGNTREYIPSGGFTQYLYHQIGDIITAPNGIRGKIVTEISDKNNSHPSLPIYSNNSDIYMKLADNDNFVEQIRVYKNRKALLDIDWNHAHDGFKLGQAHIHEWKEIKKGIWVRSTKRSLTPEEISKYVPLIRMVYPNITF